MSPCWLRSSVPPPTLPSAKRRQIEIVIGADQQIAAARISRVGVKDVVALAQKTLKPGSSPAS